VARELNCWVLAEDRSHFDRQSVKIVNP